ncbi:hypothetical protein [Ktedonospora formicarum]|uniref:Uncharacterized protein n=1 Tax=Ktedonospora formicarum TaxID=2778364 RepID=A0A8J3I2C9_9CHLR|nr:hypothetical protein [Ktedonospora formicarum]GHO44778.1 hypothetical protein KSX_29410 [Ktedonospora formicarum]
MSSEPLAESLYGLGHVVRLYADHVDVNGRVYDLARLTNVRPHYHRLFGVPSARVELHFAERKIKLRGMPDIEEAAHIVAHLNRCIRARVSPESGCAGGHIASPPYISSSPH